MNDRAYRSLNYQEVDGCRIIDLSADSDDKAKSSLFHELAEACERVAWDAEARVVVLAFDETLNQKAEVAFSQIDCQVGPFPVEHVAGLRQPVIAAIDGDATEFALELALACDIRVGTENARYGLPHIYKGLIPNNGGTQRLPRLIGCARATEMILTGRLINAGEAERFGLLNRAVPPDVLMDTVNKLARDMAQKSPLSMIYSKEALHGSRDLTLDQGLKMELDLYLLLFTASDRTEGITAFREKRKPRFKGC